jgi:hypothetical protein
MWEATKSITPYKPYLCLSWVSKGYKLKRKKVLYCFFSSSNNQSSIYFVSYSSLTSFIVFFFTKPSFHFHHNWVTPILCNVIVNSTTNTYIPRTLLFIFSLSFVFFYFVSSFSIIMKQQRCLVFKNKK